MKNILVSKKTIQVMVSVMIATFFSCSPIISLHDQYVYQQTIELKIDALNLMKLATENYSMHKNSMAELKTNLQKMYEYEKNRPKNETSIKQWEILLDENRNLLGGFMKRWEEESNLSAAFIDASSKQVALAFDQISQLESGKIKKSEIKNQ